MKCYLMIAFYHEADKVFQGVPENLKSTMIRYARQNENNERKPDETRPLHG